jgi:hypothetical protein
VKAAGLEPLSLDGMFVGHDLKKVQLRPWDTHFSVYGNEIVSAELCALITNAYPCTTGSTAGCSANTQ